MNNTLIILLIFVLVFGILYIYKSKTDADTFANVSLLPPSDYTFISSRSFLPELNVTNENITNYKSIFNQDTLDIIKGENDKMLMAKIINEKIYNDDMNIKNTAMDYKLTYNLYKRPAYY
jgi:hypothetical protein